VLGCVDANPWMDSDRDYTYEELLQRVFGIMRDKNPEMVAGEKKKFVMRPPQVGLPVLDDVIFCEEKNTNKATPFSGSGSVWVFNDFPVLDPVPGPMAMTVNFLKTFY
jgi:hypothetical protein